MHNTATLICSPRTSYSPADVGTGMRPDSGIIEPVWFLLFDKLDLRYLALDVPDKVTHVPYLSTSMADAYARVVAHAPSWQLLGDKCPGLRLLFENLEVRQYGHLILDTWAMWRRMGDACAEFCLGQMRRTQALRESLAPQYNCTLNGLKPCRNPQGECVGRRPNKSLALG